MNRKKLNEYLRITLDENGFYPDVGNIILKYVGGNIAQEQIIQEYIKFPLWESEKISFNRPDISWKKVTIVSLKSHFPKLLKKEILMNFLTSKLLHVTNSTSYHNINYKKRKFPFKDSFIPHFYPY